MLPGKKNIKGRGTAYNTDNRFEKLSVDKNFFDDLFFGDDDQKSKPGTQLFKDSSRSAIAKNDSYDVSFEYSVNPYRGCEHGCVYCYARPTHEYVGFNPALDFETKLMVKEDVAVLLEQTFNKKNYKPDVIMFSGNTDCYQPIEKKLKLTRKCLEVCLKYKNPVSLITKSSMIKRDTDILSELAKDNLVMVTFSVTTLDNELKIPPLRNDLFMKNGQTNLFH